MIVDPVQIGGFSPSLGLARYIWCPLWCVLSVFISAACLIIFSHNWDVELTNLEINPRSFNGYQSRLHKLTVFDPKRFLE